MAARTVANTTADPTVRFAKLELDGKTFRLVYRFNDIAEAEHVAGCNLLAGLENLQDLTALQLRGLLYGAMRVAQPKATIEDAGSMIRLDTIAPITRALAEAYLLSMPEKKENPPETDPPVEG